MPKDPSKLWGGTKPLTPDELEAAHRRMAGPLLKTAIYDINHHIFHDINSGFDISSYCKNGLTAKMIVQAFIDAGWDASTYAGMRNDGPYIQIKRKK